MTITLMYAGLLGLWFLVLSIRVILGRGQYSVSLGDGGHGPLNRRIRGHGNFAEYVPMVLLMLGFLEYGDAPAWLLHAIGGLLLVARLLHGIALSFSENFPPGRLLGTAGTLVALLVGSLGCLWMVFGGH